MQIWDPMENIRILDPLWKKLGSGIRDKHIGSATLFHKITKYRSESTICILALYI
jgi:hypothetical protein